MTGRDVGGLSFYLGLGYFKAAIIAAGIHARHVHGHTVGDGFEGAGTAVAPLAAAGLAALRDVATAEGVIRRCGTFTAVDRRLRASTDRSRSRQHPRTAIVHHGARHTAITRTRISRR